ncbi:DUF1682-domain-containing protein [Guyanagaster necrorhizus]|uniref:DUF1682-domain-containing protein n=1 Tax=Guyanagaster necrorhizus TaxID=856835 RepID=A0A9P7VYR4_9AGAR|nr:DUF1682-domain-containing protein [Guyanagaster necrorhizus MCA 3950]KAG7449200.1 DUF1682-domain-containing protein [Guyanagaster necrorhizus MCA 3950]
MNALTKALTHITPPPFVAPSEYHGIEYRWRFMTFRPAYFETEAYLLLALGAFVLVAIVGIGYNKNKASSWIAKQTPLLTSQFNTTSPLTWDGYSDAFTFSTGRRVVAALHTTFALRPRHDPFQVLFQLGRGLVDVQYSPRDLVELDFTLAEGAVPNDFVWAVVSKRELRGVKDYRWDLTFTKTTDHPALPANISVMSEFADVTEALLKSTPLPILLKELSNLDGFRSLSVTDQPRVRPDVPTSPSKKHVILSLYVSSSAVPPTLFSFIDTLSRINLRPETKNKLRKSREELEKTLNQEAEREEKEKKEEVNEDKRAERRRKEEERIGKLSSAEQQKYLERERKRSLRKSQGRTVRK